MRVRFQPRSKKDDSSLMRPLGVHLLLNLVRAVLRYAECRLTVYVGTLDARRSEGRTVSPSQAF